MKRILSAIFCAVLLFAAGGAIAAGMKGHVRQGGHEEHMIKALGLTAEQQAAAKPLHEEAMAKSEPLRAQVRDQWKQIDEMLDAGNANATEIGNRVIAAHTAKQQLKALHENTMSRFSALLTDEQRTKLEKLQEGRGDRGDRGGRGDHGRHEGFRR